MNTGIKHDKGKNRLDLIPVKPLKEVGRILTDGAEIYNDYNWKKGIKYSRLYAATLRHILAFWQGEDKDPDSGYDHRAHAIANLMFMMETAETWDDRPGHLPEFVFADDEALSDTDEEIAYINVDEGDQAEPKEYLKEDNEEHTIYVDYQGVCAEKHTSVDEDLEFLCENMGTTTIVAESFMSPASQYSEEVIRRFCTELWEGKL